MSEPAVAFRVQEERPALVVRVNFGVLAGRQVTPAEIDDLARVLLPVAQEFDIVAEQRHGFGGGHEAALHQVVIEVAADGDADRVVAIAERWAHACYDARHVDV